MHLIRADLVTAVARDNVARWAGGQASWSPAEWERAQRALQRALAITPGDAVLHDNLAQLHVLQGLAQWTDLDARRQSFSEARRSQEASLALRPTSGVTWAGLAVSLYAVDESAERMQFAWRQAARYAPREASVELALFDLTFATWDDASDEMHDWVLRRWATLPPNRVEKVRKLAVAHGREQLLDGID